MILYEGGWGINPINLEKEQQERFALFHERICLWLTKSERFACEKERMAPVTLSKQTNRMHNLAFKKPLISICL